MSLLRNFRFATAIFPLGTLLGCASASPVSVKPSPENTMVVGSGTADDRKIIDSSGQQIFNSEHATSPAVVPNQGLP